MNKEEILKSMQDTIEKYNDKNLINDVLYWTSIRLEISNNLVDKEEKQ